MKLNKPWPLDKPSPREIYWAGKQVRYNNRDYAVVRDLQHHERVVLASLLTSEVLVVPISEVTNYVPSAD